MSQYEVSLLEGNSQMEEGSHFPYIICHFSFVIFVVSAKDVWGQTNGK